MAVELITCTKCGSYYSSGRHKECPECAINKKEETHFKRLQTTPDDLLTRVKKQAQALEKQIDKDCTPSNKDTPCAQKPCPYCSEPVLETATLCPKCKQPIFSFDKTKNSSQYMVSFVLIFATIWLGTTMCARWEMENIHMPWAEQQTDELMQRLKAKY